MKSTDCNIYSVITYSNQIRQNHAAWAKISDGYTKEEAAKEADEESKYGNVSFEILTEDVEEWVKENSIEQD